MKTNALVLLLGIFFTFMGFAQQTIIKGSVLDEMTGAPIANVTITIEETNQTATTNSKGVFNFTINVPLGEQILKIEKVGFITKRYPIIVDKNETVDISGMTLDFDTSDKKDGFIISISDDHLNSEDDGLTDNISGLLQASKDAFLSAAAFDFSATFFRPRGLSNANGKVLINGLEMNKQRNGRPQWANWGGLNDMQRNQEFSMGTSANDYSFGDLAGTTNIIMRASKYRRGGRISYASANRSYTGRVMASYSSGLLKGDWSYSVLGSRRFGEEGYIDGTLYDANSFFIAVEKQLNEKHSINFTGIYAQNRRGRSTAITEEIYRLKGRTYNPFWGELNGEQRNSRMREINEPIVMLNHYWDISSKVRLNTNIAYQFGKMANTRIDNGGTRHIVFDGQDVYLGGARNTDPTYYQKLPSYFLNRNEVLTAGDYQAAYEAQQAFINDGQFNWLNIYSANINASARGHNAIYALQEDRIDDKQLSTSIVLDAELTDNIKLNTSISLRTLKSENFAVVKDLFGANGYLDIDFFAEDTDPSETVTNSALSDLRHPNRIAREGERYKYNYEIEANDLNAFAQAQFKYSKIDFYFAGRISSTNYQRRGLYQNGHFETNSFGKSKKAAFNNFGAKGGITYKITGKHFIDVNGSYFTKVPSINNVFENARQNNAFINTLNSEKIMSADASYIFRSPKAKMRLTAFYSTFKDGTAISFYYTEGNSGAFIQEVLTNVDKRHVGAEIGIEAQVTPTLKLKGAASIGQYIFTNNPNIYLSGDDFETDLTYGNGKTNLKDYHIAGGPERAYQIGFQYRDPDFWNIGITVNHFSNAYVDVNKLKRSARFNTNLNLITEERYAQGGNISGLTFNDYDDEIATQLLKQEQFEDYMLVNVIGGKSWRVGDYFLGFFATINNVFNQKYRTGGFEQARRVDYRSQLEEQTNPNGPVFGNRYFYGNGTTYYLNAYLRF